MNASELAAIDQWIDAHAQDMTEVSDRIWDLAEMRYAEHQSVKVLADFLDRAGFEVESDIGGIETAFRARWSNGQGPIIGFLGEYDALAGVSQEAGADHRAPIEGQPAGHACGHNLLGTGSAAAAIAAKAAMEYSGLTGTLEFYGCPAEEGGSGKTFMAREGVFDGVDAFLTWHTWDVTAAWANSTAANVQARFRFRGTSAHAAESPHLGRSALDAVELMNIGANYLREHIVPEARVHYAVTNTGGASPNVVQPEAEVLYLMRGPEMHIAQDIFSRVQDIARGAALMTGTEVEVVFEKACSNYLPNAVLTELMAEELHAVGAPRWDDADLGLAERMQADYSEADLATFRAGALRFMAGRDPEGVVGKQVGKALSDAVLPYHGLGAPIQASTDVGDVSRVAPTAQCVVAGLPVGTGLHSWQVVSCGKSGIGHKSEAVAAKTLGRTALRLLAQPELVRSAREEYTEVTGGEPYQSPIPPEVSPEAFQK